MAARESVVLKNLKKPTGFYGELVAEHMEDEYHQINMWATEVINIQPQDHLLEIGFGSGIAIAEMARLSFDGHVAGIDYSELMVAKARKRNAQAIQTGRVNLYHADVSKQLPEFDIRFDKIVAINNVMYWKQPIKALERLKQLLKPNGSIALFRLWNEQDVINGAEGLKQEIEWYMYCLRQAGFSNVGVMTQPMRKPFRNLNAIDTKELNYSDPFNIAGICIYGFNVPLEQFITEYYSNQHQPYILSKQLLLKKLNNSPFSAMLTKRLVKEAFRPQKNWNMILGVISTLFTLISLRHTNF